MKKLFQFSLAVVLSVVLIGGARTPEQQEAQRVQREERQQAWQDKVAQWKQDNEAKKTENQAAWNQQVEEWKVQQEKNRQEWESTRGEREEEWRKKWEEAWEQWDQQAKEKVAALKNQHYENVKNLTPEQEQGIRDVFHTWTDVDDLQADKMLAEIQANPHLTDKNKTDLTRWVNNLRNLTPAQRAWAHRMIDDWDVKGKWLEGLERRWPELQN